MDNRSEELSWLKQFREDCTAGVTIDGEILNAPCGYRFAPTDLDLVEHYLGYQILGEPLSSKAIQEIDPYKYDPHQIPNPIGNTKFGKPDVKYCFYNLDEKYVKGAEQTKRITDGGYWLLSGSEEVFSGEQVIGFKAIFDFHSTEASEDWVMEEFKIHFTLVPADKLDDTIKTKIESYVLCKIHTRNNSNMEDIQNNTMETLKTFISNRLSRKK